MSTTSQNTPSLAVLDDYLSVSAPHFKHISSSDVDIQVFTSPMPHRTESDQAAFAEKLKPFTAISTMRERTPFPGSLLRKLPNLKVLFCTGTQFETFDLETAKQLGITVVAAPGRGVTQRGATPQKKTQDIRKGIFHPTTHHAWAMILSLARNVSFDDASIKAGGWQTGMAMGLHHKTIGVLGLGRLGAAAARTGIVAFGMKAICWSQNLTQEKADAAAVAIGLPAEDEDGDKTFKVVSKEEFFRQADVISLHYVLGPRSRGIVGRQELRAMKKDALLVNTSRGPLIDEPALLEAIRAGHLRGVALDVFEEEPLPLNSPWRSNAWGKDGTTKVLVTPHMGYVEEGLVNNWYAETAENVERWLVGDELLHRLV